MDKEHYTNASWEIVMKALEENIAEGIENYKKELVRKFKEQMAVKQ